MSSFPISNSASKAERVFCGGHACLSSSPPPSWQPTLLPLTTRPSFVPPQCENESALNLYETCKVRTVKAGTLEKLVEHLVLAFRDSDLSYVTVFLCTYQAFTTTQQVLDLLFKR